jgi:3-hydroxybutyryl-CoA dehydrogenase
MTNQITIGVVGAGLMGSGIAQACAVAGFDTTVQDAVPGALQQADAGIRKSLAKLVEKGKLTAAEQSAALGRLRFTGELAALSGCGCIIEAITEDLAQKNRVWQTLDGMVGPSTIFASNTSSLSIITMAAATSRPDRFVGLHFFNPVPLMPLVEVVRTVRTSQATVDTALALVRQLGKEPIVAQDRSGFVVNLLLVPYLLDAIRALEHGVASITDIDTGMRLGAGHPMGPLTLADFVGLDTLARIGDIMVEEYREARYAAPPLLKRMVTAGLFGRKSGQGFYDYRRDPPAPMELGL